MASVLVPVAYVIIIFGGLFIFSYFYRKRTATKIYEPYFPSHPERNAYITLLQKSDPPASDALLKSALVRRAMADVQRVLRIREDKPALQNLLQKGSIGDELWNSLLAAEKELEAEIMEVVAEANSFVEGWGGVIFPTANEMIANEKMRAAFERTTELKAEIEAKYDLQSKPLVDATAVTNKALNGLLSAPSQGVSSAASSDNEGSTTSRSGKKAKKRK
jgi:translocation protein SEC66